MKAQETIHTTINISLPLMKKAMKLFKGKTKTQIIHESLERMIQSESLEKHFRTWKGKGKFKSYE